MIESSMLTSVAFQMSLLLAVALAGYLLAMRINQSAVVGVILVGIIFGPSLFGLITYSEFVASIAEIGAIFLLFVVGLEFKLEELIQPKYFFIALGGVIVPWIGGFLITKAFGFNSAAALIVGSALTATSIAITANVLREMGKLKTEAAKAIIGAAVIDDVLGLLVLSVSLSAASGQFNVSDILFLCLKAIAFLIIGIVVGYFYLSKIILKIDKSKIAEKYSEFAFIFALMIAFVYALFAELVGLSAIVGAFIAGVSLEGIVLHKSKSYHEGTEYLYIIFSSLFFVSLGVLVNLRELSWFALLFFIILTAVAVLSKFIGCSVPSIIQGFNKKDSSVIGFGMVPRGEVAMIIALLGLSKGFIGQDVYIAIVLMSILTTIITPLTLKNWLYADEARITIEKRKNKFFIVKKE